LILAKCGAVQKTALQNLAALAKYNCMPSGKTHDAITFLLAAPVGVATYLLTKSVPASMAVASAFLFGGLMFGPDLDTASKQYTRWWILKPLWFPYKMFFKHRSRWSHGLIFGTLLRVIYFMGVVTLGAFLTAILVGIFLGGNLPGMAEFAEGWRRFGEFGRIHLGENIFVVVFCGLWLGAASHTFTDMAGTFIKTGRVSEFL
jgi:uncharacterized metal-binding protein